MTQSLTIHNPIFYDLGRKFDRSLTTLQQVKALVKATFPHWSEKAQGFEFQAYNFSYLSLHLPPIAFYVAETPLKIGDVSVVANLVVSIRLNGTLCFEYCFEVEVDKHHQLDDVVSVLQSYVNIAYKRDLQRKGAFKNAMTQIALPELSEIPSIFANGDIIDQIQSMLSQNNLGEQNDYVYPYQHGRLLFSCDSKESESAKLLLSEGFVRSAQTVCNGEIYLDTWKTVITSEASSRNLFLELYLENLNNFFQCQIWIFQCEFMLSDIESKVTTKELDYEALNAQATAIENFYFNCNRQMINFTNLSIPFKNDYYTELSKAIVDAIKVKQHIEQTEKHLSAVKEHINIAKIHTDSRTERHTKLLKLLMALNLSAGIASLIPSSLDGDITKFSSSILPPLVWVTFAVIAGLILYLETRNKKD